MRQRTLIIALLLATVALAGCVGGDDATGSDAGTASTDDPQFGAANETEENQTVEDPEPEGPSVNVTWNNGTVQGGSLVLFPYCFPACENYYSFEVPNGTTGIVVELAWNASAALTLDVEPPTEYCERGPAGILITSCPDGAEDDDGDSPARVEITDPQKLEMNGEWNVFVWPQDTYAQPVEYTSAASVFTGDQIPRGYAKLGAGP